MILDGHVHILNLKDDRNEFVDRLKQAGMDGCVIFSMPPETLGLTEAVPAPQRLDNLMLWADPANHIYPLFFVDPHEGDAIEQVHLAVERGVLGFKIICNLHDPGHPRAMEVYREIAALKKPILFHSGILHDGRVSGEHNRPIKFEALIDVPGLRFALAHVSWPWCDECMAVFGKIWNLNWRNPDLDIEMYIDTTPGTPPVRRQWALSGVVGYEVKPKAFFGTDSHANDYDVKWAGECIQRDSEIYDALGLDEQAKGNIFSRAVLEFLGVE